jgi:hypothetical protein
MALNINVYVLLIFFIVKILCLRDETLIKYWIENWITMFLRYFLIITIVKLQYNDK